MAYDVTRDLTLAAQGGMRDCRIYGWKWLHVIVAETRDTKAWGICSFIGPFHLSSYFQLIR